MLDCPNLVNDQSRFTLCSAVQQQTRGDRQRLDEGEDSRVSTDSDLDLETEDEDDCPSTFSCLLMRKLVAVELAQQQEALREEGLAPVTSLHLLAGADDSYWAKMRRVSQWRESTLQSEAQSETHSEVPSEASSNYSPPAGMSRKRSLSDASLPAALKRSRLTPLSPASPASPLFPRARPYHVDVRKSKSSADLGVYGKIVRAQLTVQPCPSLGALHVCSACESSFASRQRLRRHGHGAWTPDACRAAVTYGLE